MKILTWNCNGAFRKKSHALDNYDADILVIQECENPSEIQYPELFLDRYSHYAWFGDNKNKGLGVFSKLNIDINNWDNTKAKYFISCKINNKFNLIGAWCHQAKSPTFAYIGQLWKYLILNLSRFEESETILCGDFNSNKKWDVWDRWWNHSDVIRILNDMGIKSLYHQYFNEEQGDESCDTFFQQKNIDKAYHIDYVFGSPMFQNSLRNLEVENYQEWKQYSDHVPLVCVVEI